ncbi:MAG: hypothetical protein RJQ09_01085 [Cyclobacteriaceae bacterium]
MKNLSDDGKKILAYYSSSIFKNKPMDDEYDELIRSSVQNLFEYALNRVDLLKSQCDRPAVMLRGIPRLEKINKDDFRIKTGKDNLIRYFPFEVTIYNFTIDSLVAYQCDFDPSTRVTLNESTFEYYYEDIVSLETLSASRSEINYTTVEAIVNKIPILKDVLNTGEISQYDLSQKFILTTSGGTKLPVTIADYILKAKTDDGDFPLAESFKAITTIRKHIRDKKSAVVTKSNRGLSKDDVYLRMLTGDWPEKK